MKLKTIFKYCAFVFLTFFLIVAIVLYFQVSEQFNFPEFVSAAGSGNIKYVEFHLDHGTDPDAPRLKGIRATEMAAFNGQIQMVRLLLDHKADPQYGIYDAITRNNEEETLLFLKYGADPLRRSNRRRVSPLEHAIKAGNPKFINLLRSYNHPGNSQPGKG